MVSVWKDHNTALRLLPHNHKRLQLHIKTFSSKWALRDGNIHVSARNYPKLILTCVHVHNIAKQIIHSFNMDMLILCSIYREEQALWSSPKMTSQPLSHPGPTECLLQWWSWGWMGFSQPATATQNIENLIARLCNLYSQVLELLVFRVARAN